jgi:hypothetical protein
MRLFAYHGHGRLRHHHCSAANCAAHPTVRTPYADMRPTPATHHSPHVRTARRRACRPARRACSIRHGRLASRYSRLFARYAPYAMAAPPAGSRRTHACAAHSADTPTACHVAPPSTPYSNSAIHAVSPHVAPTQQSAPRVRTPAPSLQMAYRHTPLQYGVPRAPTTRA